MLKRLFLIVLIACFSVAGSFAQGAADKIVGTYFTQFANNDAKVKAFKYKDGYRFQICWLKKTHNDDGTLKLDEKNPDETKRSTPMSKVVLVDKVIYRDGIWQDGHIYDPKHGKIYKVELKLTGKSLEVKGKLGPFHKCMYWKKLD